MAVLSSFVPGSLYAGSRDGHFQSNLCYAFRAFLLAITVTIEIDAGEDTANLEKLEKRYASLC